MAHEAPITWAIPKKSFKSPPDMQKIPTMVPVVAAAILRGDGCVLMQRRRAEQHHGGLWEFPGGKVEPHEAPEDALVREVREELGLVLVRSSLRPLTFASDPREPPGLRAPHVILLYFCAEWSGEPAAFEAAELGWFPVEELSGLAMPPLDYPLAEALARAI